MTRKLIAALALGLISWGLAGTAAADMGRLVKSPMPPISKTAPSA